MSYEPTLRQLEYVVAVADQGRFGAAARATAVSQPALSKQIQQVEDGLGVRLFERTPRGALPTPAGRVLVGRARQVLAASQELVDAAAALRDPFAGVARVGAIPTLAPWVLPGLVAAVAEALPAVQLRLVEEQTATLGGLLGRGELDLAIVALPFDQPGVAVRGLYEDPLHVVAPLDHPLAGDGPLLPSTVSAHPALLLRQGHCLRDHALQACRVDRTAPAALEATSLTTLLLMVRQGLGYSLVPEMALPEDRTGLSVRPFLPPVPTRGVGLWWRPSSPRTPLFERLGDLLIDSRPT